MVSRAWQSLVNNINNTGLNSTVGKKNIGTEIAS